jgi:hypothetical protein
MHTVADLSPRRSASCKYLFGYQLVLRQRFRYIWFFDLGRTWDLTFPHANSTDRKTYELKGVLALKLRRL